MLPEPPEVAEQPRAPERGSEAVEVRKYVLEGRGPDPDPEPEDVDLPDGVVHLVQPDGRQEDQEAAAQDAVDELVPENGFKKVLIKH